MPSYNVANVSTALYQGDQIALVNNGATDTGVTKTMQVAITSVPQGGDGDKLTLFNTTTQTATVQTCWHDVDADYQPLKDADTGQAITVATNSSIVFTCIGPLLRCTIASAPTSGSLVLSR
jgi:hypothetical protein